MAALSGTLVASRIVPSDTLDTYATHDAEYGRDGHRSCATIAERDAITDQRRKEGMTVWVQSEQKEYRLIGGILNTNWQEVTGGSFNPSSLTEITTMLNTDFMVVIKDGVAYKITADNFVKSIITIVGNEVTYNGATVTYNGSTVTYGV